MNNFYCLQHGKEHPPCPECASNGNSQFYPDTMKYIYNQTEIKLDKIIKLLQELIDKSDNNL